MRLFRVTDDFEIEILPETLLYPEFNAIVKRGKKDKDKVIKELAYIYHMSNLESPYASYPPKERHKRLVNDLFNNHLWQPDELVSKGIDRYKEENHTATSKTIETVINALYKANVIVNTLIEEIEQNLQDNKHKSGINNKKGQIVSGIELMLNDLQSLIKTSNEIPKSIDVFEKLLDKIIKEKEMKESRFRGGSQVSDFEKA
jgi:predicted transcriptional regulator